ncbi:hypothetical protein V8G54_037464 [Vigna mungo]|uniref:CCHC-type domain-containing protein n=1 Tax=Vigna mungo TaxID=3915 RepID=A0AAQ3MJE3_VIGMU
MSPFVQSRAGRLHVEGTLMPKGGFMEVRGGIMVSGDRGGLSRIRPDSTINHIMDETDKSPDDQEEETESTERKVGFNKNMKKKARRNIECFTCHKMGHYSYECYSNKGKQSKKDQNREAYLAKEDSDLEPFILMAGFWITTTNADCEKDQVKEKRKREKEKDTINRIMHETGNSPYDQEEETESTKRKGGFNKNMKKKDRRNIECFMCHKMGHYLYDYYLNKDKQSKKDQNKEAYLEKEDSDSKPLILMVTTFF